MEFMKFFKQISLQTRLLFFMILVLAVILTGAGVIIYQQQTTRMRENIEERMEASANYLLRMVEEQKAYHHVRLRQLSRTIDMFLNNYTPYIDKDLERNAIKERLSRQMKGREYNYQKILKNFEMNRIIEKGDPLIINKQGRTIRNTRNGIKIGFRKDWYRKVSAYIDKRFHTISLSSKKAGGPSYNYYFSYYLPDESYVGLLIPENELVQLSYPLRNRLIGIILFSLIGASVLLYLVLTPLTRWLQKVLGMVKTLSYGKLPQPVKYNRQDEIGATVGYLNELTNGLHRLLDFSEELKKGNFYAEYKPLSREDALGNALTEMRESFREIEEERNKQIKEEEQRNWASAGLAKFADLLRVNTNDLEALSYDVITRLVKYVDMIQGGLFISTTDEESNQTYLELMGCFAYDRRKYVKKYVQPGEGLVGTCYIEQKRIYINNLPEGYMDIASGTGETEPRSLLIVPLVVNEQALGVIELAGIHDLENYQIDFVERVAESIASTISSVKTNIETKRLLEQSQKQSDELKSQEEELRQNMEELQTTQEEANRREKELSAVLSAVDSAIGTIELDMQGYIRNANNQYRQITGMTWNELEGKTLTDYMAPDMDVDKLYETMWQRIMNGNTYSGRHHYRFKGGDKWFRETFTPVKDANEEFSKIIVLVSDSTYIKKMEDEIQELKKDQS